MSALLKRPVFGIRISTGTFGEHITAFADLGEAHRSSYVCCVNVHMCMEAQDHPDFMEVVNNADFATADGMPVLNKLNRLHGLQQERVAGNDIMPALLAEAERRGLGVFLYGGSESVLQKISDRAAKEHPRLRIAGTWSPPFRALTEAEQQDSVERINASGANIVMVSLGCPKQERWMAAMKGRVKAVMLGVGGAFLLYAGVDTRAPKWMRDLSLEWLYRLALEPGRLWKRYLITNSRFLWMSATAKDGNHPWK
jgi:N-acetylglucosaminyldiphosphoundecaprenol N-acetyl-beta-D-mannosaminyltransferase